jgi:hypothetical protein
MCFDTSVIRSALLVTLIGVLLLTAAGDASTGDDERPYFHKDDPVWIDRDDFVTPQPQEVKLSQYYDFFENTFFKVGTRGDPGAQNVNTLGEVPNSSWFTNRHGRRRLTVDEIVKGPNRGDGPDTTSPWTIVSAKTEGITPGFVIRDAQGTIYFIKVDPLAYPEMATSAEAICTPLFHAMGYNVPENYLLDIPVGMINVGEEATVKDKYGKKRRMTDEDLASILRRAPVRGDGTLRVIASKAIAGESLGHFRYYGTRPDDANDVVPHQYRRELRGLRLFAAWLNHDDTRSINSLDVYTDDQYVKHYLIDFGSCLGSGSVKPQTRRAGNEYMWEAWPTFKTMATLGLWARPYLKIDYPDHPSIGRFESEAFRAELWRPEYPNPAFQLMDERDAFWAAKIVMSFTDEEVRAVVENGGMSDDEARAYMIRTLLERRDKIGRYYLNLTNPVDEFYVEGSVLDFSNLSVKYGFGKHPSGYTISWWAYDNETRSPTEQIGEPAHASPGPSSDELARSIEGERAGTMRTSIPSAWGGLSAPSNIVAEITPTDDGRPEWLIPVRVYFRSTRSGWEIVGVSRTGKRW